MALTKLTPLTSKMNSEWHMILLACTCQFWLKFLNETFLQCSLFMTPVWTIYHVQYTCIFMK